MQIHVGFPGREELWLSWDEKSQLENPQAQLRAVGPLAFLESVAKWRAQLKGPVICWPLPEGDSSADLLLREAILKAKGQWNPPYQDAEICHCRMVPTQKVVAAIVAGAHTPQQVSRWTSASTACGTCRPDVESLLEYMRGKKSA